jgi:DNA-binding LacI/PurR family transcriptional regulator/anti-anti-sigma regulatory factor
MQKTPRPIGVISSDFGGYYFGAMLSGIYQAARKAGAPLIVIKESLGSQQLPTFGSDYIAGWLVIHPSAADRANLAVLCAADAPVVTLPVPIEGVHCTLVQVDNRGGMCAAVSHLIDHGHRHIAYIDHGPEGWSQQRYLGYCDALEGHGIAHDSALVIRLESALPDGAALHQLRGSHAAQYLLDLGGPCSALAGATDTSAIAAMKALQAAGRRIPEELAVVGFDDITEAQYASPPLTTVRTRFEAIGRAAAEQLLTEIREGRATQDLIISVSTAVLHRNSCGCTTLDELLEDDDTTNSHSADWQAKLTRQLVQVVQYPLPLDPGVQPAQLWPGASTLVTAISSALQGQSPPLTGIETAWQQAIAQTENLEALDTVLVLLEDAAQQQLAATPATAARLTTLGLLRRMRLELMRARLAQEIEAREHLGRQVQSNYAVSMALLGSSAGSARALGWLESTPAVWGCLGLWDAERDTPARSLMIAGAYHRDATPSIRVGQRIPVTAFPPLSHLPIGAQQGQELTILCPVSTKTQQWGVLALCGWSDQPLTAGTENLTIQATLLGATLDRDAVLSALTEQQATLHAAYERERVLSQTIRELGCPIIPLLPGVLLVPLIGALDSARAQQVIGAVLEAIANQGAQTVLLDVTGVPLVDTQVASSLVQTGQAARLLGAQVIMVGIRPEIAQSIVGLGIDLQHLKIYATLDSAISKLQLERRSR